MTEEDQSMRTYRVILLHKHLGTKHEFIVRAPTIHRALPAAQKILEGHIARKTLISHPLDFVQFSIVEIPDEV